MAPGKKGAKIKLFWSPDSQPSRAMKAFLVAAKVPHTEQILDFMKGEQKKPPYDKLNPSGAVPFITVDDMPLAQTTAMLRYISRSYDAGKPYYAACDTWTRAEIDKWLDFYGTDYRPCVTPLVRCAFKIMGKSAEEVPDDIKKQMSDAFVAYDAKLQFMEDHLKKTGYKYIAGPQMTLADFVLFSETWDFWYWKKMELVAKHPCVMNWFKTCMMSPGTKEVMGPGSVMMSQVLPKSFKMLDGSRFSVPNTLDDHVKLHYFAMYGRSSPIAAMLEMGGADWEYCGFSFEEWPALKPTMVGGSVPNLEFADGVKIGESLDIARLIGVKFKLYPEDPVAARECNELMMHFAGYLDDMTGWVTAQDAGKKEAAMKKAINEATPAYIKKVSDTLAAKKTPFLCGDKATVADFFAGKYYVDMLNNTNCPMHEPTQAAVKASPVF
jgi:glutathione S-transferase